MRQKMLLMERGRMLKMKLVMTKEMNLQMTRTTVVLLHSYLDRAHMPLEVKSGMFHVTLKPQTFTRRAILSIVASVYDPIGFLAPFIFTAKYILQELCKLSCGWDDEIPSAYHLKWQQWLVGLRQMESYKVNRCIKPKSFGAVASAQLHNFCDASEVGYGVVTYLRLTNTEDAVHTAFLFGKTRVAPLKRVTIPRLELTAAMLAVKIDKMLKTELQTPLANSVFWTDSTSVLKYIRNDTKRFQTFVANRVGVIRESTDIDQWRHIATERNPADLASRALRPSASLHSSPRLQRSILTQPIRGSPQAGPAAGSCLGPAAA
ncbi:uncharacterized protein LOC130380621 [Gadus chalcogrammus]|uniref:uncharacterized protein LOC130380621 n=1 Tax=Gadus chalcogrammus TaxID=1042646 RepID=UPI0024C34CF8|nr:uncharacterized protein LOC130380621 [Gadus chalcogrammus]